MVRTTIQARASGLKVILYNICLGFTSNPEALSFTETNILHVKIVMPRLKIILLHVHRLKIILVSESGLKINLRQRGLSRHFTKGYPFTIDT